MYPRGGGNGWDAKDGCDVLILVLVEDSLRAQIDYFDRNFFSRVLILVLVEDSLRAESIPPDCAEKASLNPCFSGR